MRNPRPVLIAFPEAFCNRRLPILVVILAILFGPVQCFNLKNVPKYSDNEKRCQSLGSTVRSRKNFFAELPSNSNDRNAQRETQFSFAILASTAEPHNDQFASVTLLKRRRLLKLVTVPIICGIFYLFLIPSAHAATVPTIKDSKRIILTDRQSILIKGFISGACINFAKNILLHPIETGKIKYSAFNYCSAVKERNGDLIDYKLSRNYIINLDMFSPRKKLNRKLMITKNSLFIVSLTFIQL